LKYVYKEEKTCEEALWEQESKPLFKKTASNKGQAISFQDLTGRPA
jgi:hypothetical protein